MISGFVRRLLVAGTAAVAFHPVFAAPTSPHVVGPATDLPYPAVAEWARAGVRGGIPADLPVLATVTPGHDLQAALDTTAAQGGGVVELAPGDFLLTQTLRLRSGVVLRGAAAGESRLHVKLRGHAPAGVDAGGFSDWTTGIHGRDVRKAGLERLTIVFDTSLPAPPRAGTDKQPYVNNPGQRDDLWVVSVRLTQSENCWIDACRILDSGTDPLRLEGCRHVTVRATEIADTHNKGDPDAGNVVLAGCEHTLVDGLVARDLHHVVLQAATATQPCRFNVLTRCRLAVDVNFRGGGTERNLVEDCTIELPPAHPATPFSIGLPKRRQPPGPGNLVHRCRAAHTFVKAERNYSVAGDPAQVYVLIADFNLERKAPRFLLPYGPAPANGTLFPSPSTHP